MKLRNLLGNSQDIWRIKTLIWKQNSEFIMKCFNNCLLGFYLSDPVPRVLWAKLQEIVLWVPKYPLTKVVKFESLDPICASRLYNSILDEFKWKLKFDGVGIKNNKKIMRLFTMGSWLLTKIFLVRHNFGYWSVLRKL